MKCFELFSGIGGFGLALKNLNHEIVGACEIDEYARRIYARHFEGVRIYKDATTIEPKELPEFELLCAGFPCQSFSIAGKRRGFDDTRGTLFFEIIKIAKERKPSYLLLENVKGLLSDDEGKTFRTILRALDEIGYDAEWQIINSKYFVPQSRERIFIIGHLREKSGSKVFPLGEVCELFEKVRSPSYLPSLTATDYKGASKQRITNVVVQSLKQVGNVDTKGNNSLWGRVYDPDGLAVTLRSDVGGLGAKTGLYAVDESKLLAWSKSTRNWGTEARIKEDEANTLNTGDGCRNQSTQNYVAEFGIDDKGRKISNSLRSGGRGSVDRHSWDIVNDGMKIRKLTPIECERLQGFPDNWTKGVSDTQRYKCIGNSVTVPVIEYIVSHMELP